MEFPIASVRDLETLSAKVKWQYFERLVGYIFEKNGYEVRHNVVLSRKGTKRQYDIIASRFGKVYLVECKKWKKQTGLRAAAAKHRERCEFYGSGEPLVVTLSDSNILTINNMPIVPITSLNGFLNE